MMPRKIPLNPASDDHELSITQSLNPQVLRLLLDSPGSDCKSIDFFMQSNQLHLRNGGTLKALTEEESTLTSRVINYLNHLVESMVSGKLELTAIKWDNSFRNMPIEKKIYAMVLTTIGRRLQSGALGDRFADERDTKLRENRIRRFLKGISDRFNLGLIVRDRSDPGMCYPLEWSAQSVSGDISMNFTEMSENPAKFKREWENLVATRKAIDKLAECDSFCTFEF